MSKGEIDMGIFARWFGPDEVPVREWWKALEPDLFPYSTLSTKPVERSEFSRALIDQRLDQLSECLFGLLKIRTKISQLFEGDQANTKTHLEHIDAVVTDLWKQWLIYGGGPVDVMLRVADDSLISEEK